MISASNEQLQQQLEYTLLKPDCHSWWISKMQSGHEDTLEEWYAIKFCFKLGKKWCHRNVCFRLLLEHLAWIEHQFLSGIRDSMKAGSLWGMRGVWGVRKSIHQSWLGLGLLCWGFKAVQEEILPEEASTLQIGSVAFLPGCRYETIVEMKEAVTKVIDMLTQEDFQWGLPEVVGMVQVHCSRRRLLQRGLEFHVCTINKTDYTKKSGNLFNDPCTLHGTHVYKFLSQGQNVIHINIFK